MQHDRQGGFQHHGGGGGGLMIPGPPGGPAMILAGGAFDGKRMRKAIQRTTIDHYSSLMRHIERRKSLTRPKYMQPDLNFSIDLQPTRAYLDNPSFAITTNFVHSSMNKQKCPINCVKWTPDGRRLITGASSGEFTLWNGLTFNFETILQAHDKAIRAMMWSHNDTWMVTADDLGIIKYWQSSMNNLKAFQGHKDVIRDLTFSPSDNKFASCSDDGTVKIWNFMDASEERILTGHGWDVKCIDWHPSKCLLASGSKDNLVKLWDPKTGKSLANLHGHKNTILGIKWNKNGNYLLTGARDQLIRVYDIRAMKEVQTFRGHKRDVTSLAWHPIHETLFVSGGWDGTVYFWEMGMAESIGGMPEAHDSAVWSLDWHPLGHMLATGSNDYSARFWTRNRPGDSMRNRFDMSKDQAEAMGISLEISQEEQPMQQPSTFNSQQQARVPFNIPGMGSRAVPGLSGSMRVEEDNASIDSRQQNYQQRQGQAYGRHQGNFGGEGRGGYGVDIQTESNYYVGQGGGNPERSLPAPWNQNARIDSYLNTQTQNQGQHGQGNFGRQHQGQNGGFNHYPGQQVQGNDLFRSQNPNFYNNEQFDGPPGTQAYRQDHRPLNVAHGQPPPPRGRQYQQR